MSLSWDADIIYSEFQNVSFCPLVETQEAGHYFNCNWVCGERELGALPAYTSLLWMGFTPSSALPWLADMIRHLVLLELRIKQPSLVSPMVNAF